MLPALSAGNLRAYRSIATVAGLWRDRAYRDRGGYPMSDAGMLTSRCPSINAFMKTLPSSCGPRNERAGLERLV